MSTVLVVPLRLVTDTVRKRGIRDLVTCLKDPAVATPEGVATGRHLRLAMDDIEREMEGQAPPSQQHAAALIDFVRTWDQKSPMLIHCHAGMSRSPAAAFIAQCVLNPDVEELVLAEGLRAAAPRAWPNRLLVAHADRLLEREGRMERAILSIGPGALIAASAPFSLPARMTSRA